MSEQGKNRPSINAEEHRRPRARTHAPRLSDMTTFRVGGPVATLVEPCTEDAFIDAVRRADDEHSPDRLLILGGGSNILADDAPFDGTVIRDARASLETDVTWTPSEPSAPQSSPVIVTAASGVAWDALVNESVKRGLSGLEALSGIPGTVGAAPVQNIGAYGGEVAHTLLHIGAWDRLEQRRVELPHDDLELGYRSSILKQSRLTPRMDGSQWGPTGRWVVLDVTLQLTRSHMSAPVAYSQLARALDVPIGQQVETNRVRSEVLRLRASKGMVIDEGNHDTWSAGSFFTNPILDAHEAERLLPPEAPRFDAGRGLVKTSAAWLIDRAGFGKGFALSDECEPCGGHSSARASLSTKHVLALTNRGGACAQDIRDLARAVRAGVKGSFGVTLVPEPVVLGEQI